MEFYYWNSYRAFCGRAWTDRVKKITGKISSLFKTLLTDLTEGSTQGASAAGQISESSQSLSDGAAQQAASIEETSSDMEEISSMVNQDADNAKGNSSATSDRINRINMIIVSSCRSFTLNP